MEKIGRKIIICFNQFILICYHFPQQLKVYYNWAKNILEM